ncbi:GNAT family N-acetyltransferase [Alteribacillus bidgolensis]|uniref:Lysine N-acyltransferase MbtK n=1 Tax=Alteribacillus bidgolensis TaxID=930129 RepID=A0A1G8IJC8_9BACI|nr:GNAT family N-acetyltransferase [Alteribacillus bidgolensis]SDI18630.1 Protein N-acetyltransferase, RimJ/RimL family [Alteribacillus bidgolensis]
MITHMKQTSYKNELADGQSVEFRPFQRREDEERLFQWMHKEHVIPYWQLNLTREAFRSHIDKAVRDTHQQLWIGLVNGIPMSYWETYDVKDDVVGRHYKYQLDDQGVHLLFGPESFLGKGLAAPLVKEMLSLIYDHSKAVKIVAEPDIRNHKMIHVFQKCGFQPVKPINLPDKIGLLMVHYREKGGEMLER